MKPSLLSNDFPHVYRKLAFLPWPVYLYKPDIYPMDFMISAFGENTAYALGDQLTYNVFLSVYRTIASFNDFADTRAKLAFIDLD